MRVRATPARSTKHRALHAALTALAMLLAGCPAPEMRDASTDDSPIARPDCSDAASADAPLPPSPVTCDGGLCVIDRDVVLTPDTTVIIANALAGASDLRVSRADSFLPGDEVLVHDTQGEHAGRYALHRIARIDGDVLALSSPLAESYSTSDRVQVVRVLRFPSLRITESTTVSVAPWNGTTGGVLAIRVDGTAQIDGTISVTGRGFRGGAGGTGHRTCAGGAQGESPLGIGRTSAEANGGGGGGGRGGCSCCGGACGSGPGGGGGGHGSRGGGGVATECSLGASGESYGDAALSSMFLGSGGGGGAGNCDEDAPPGAAGGGILVLIADSIALRGSIDASGLEARSEPTGLYAHWEGSGGSGAGGTVYLAARSVTTTGGTGAIVAMGGAANHPCASPESGVGGAGGAGRVRVECTTFDGVACTTAASPPSWQPSAAFATRCTDPRTCVCASGTTNCDGACVDVANDSRHCGGCGTACAPGQLCDRGLCVAQCASPHVACAVDGGAHCADLSADPRHCGACDAACIRGETCESGTCGCAGGLRCGDTCVDVSSDVRNCGACGNRCAPAQLCIAGRCTTECAADRTACGIACVDLRVDLLNCGCCGNVCSASQTCTDGICRGPACDPDTRTCSRCGDVRTDPANCGACGVRCGGGATCVDGQCECLFRTLCSGECIDTASDDVNCGSCGHRCAALERCTGGSCTCAAGATACGGSCADLARDPAHCGSCTTACASGEECVLGTCTCAVGRTHCPDGSCAELNGDPRHCGSCSVACATGSLCVNGGCAQ